MTSLLLIGMALCPQVVVMLPPRACSAENQDAATSRPAAVVTYRVIGLMKTKSGAT